MRYDEFTNACERLALGKEIKRQEAEAAKLIRAIEVKRAKLVHLERLAARRAEVTSTPFIGEQVFL